MVDRRAFYFLILSFLSNLIWAQTPISDFTVQGTACLQERLKISNLSSNATSYEWDFCLGDIATIKSSTDHASVSNLNYGANLKLLFDQGKWYGFVLSENNSRLIRLDFGNDLSSVPAVVDLGNPGGQLGFPEGLDIIKAGVNWFGFVGHLDIGRGIVRLSFGSSLENIPTASNIGDFGFSVRFRDLKIVNQGGNYILVLSNYNDNSLVRVNFGTDITNASPTVASTGAIANIFLPIGIDMVKLGGNWIAHVASYGNNKLIQLNFGNDLLSAPSVEGTYTFSGLNQPRNNRILLEGDNYYSIISNESGGIQIIDFKDLNPSSTPVNLNLGGLPDAIGFDIVRLNGKEVFYSVPATGNTLKQVVFEASCGASINYSVSVEPNVKYTSSGSKRIELIALLGSQRTSSIKTTNVSSSVAPVSTISTDGAICAGSPVGFTASPDANIQTFSWDFGDATSSNGASTSHIYGAGSYVVELLLTGTNGCVNFDQKPIEIFTPPVSAFSLPTVSTFCTNQPYTFINESVISPGTNPSFQWMINGGNVSTNKDLTLPFTDTSAKEITLLVSMPGCNSIASQTINSIQVGPVVDFTQPAINCQDSGVAFVNQTTGSISYAWIFDDGNTSTQENPTNTFLNAGSYDVTLQATNSSGCQNFVTKPVNIYSKPQTDFSIDLPPFSCAGSPSQFNDLTPPLTDSNITTWSWGFGDSGNGTSTQKNPTYTYALAGDYQVSLSTTTNFGCTASNQKQVTISTPPSINFSNGIACLNQGTQFTDASDPAVKAWLWSIQNSTYATKNTTHVFSATGSLPVMLTVTGNNNCVSQISKTLIVPVPAIPDFTAISTCAGKSTVFQEKNAGGNDPAVSWSWDFGGQGVGSGSPAEYIFPTTGSYAVKMNTTRQSGCVYSVIKSVAISQAPRAQFTPSVESGGSPLTIGFTNTSTLATSYLWKFNDVNNSTSNEFSPSFIFNQLGEYLVELIASNSFECEDSFLKMVQVVVPNINSVLTEFKLIPSGGSMKAQVTIKNQGNISITNPEVIIDLSGNTSVKEKLVGTIPPNQSLTRTLSIDIISKNLQYACAELNTIGDAYLFDNRQCINLQTETIAIQPYPNPAQDDLFIDWINPGSESMRVIIYNASGQIVMDKKYNPVLLGLNQVKVNVSNLGAGIYFVTYFDGSISRTTRFSIVR